MADELTILTENAASDSWVDAIPSAVSTGYQAQNTNINANRNGIDSSYVRYDSGTDEIVVEESGPIDDNGLPFSVGTEIRFSNPGAGTWYLRVIPGTTTVDRSLEITSSKGTWDGSKNALYDSVPRRVLNWEIEAVTGNATVFKIFPNTIQTKIVEIGDWDMDTDSTKNVLHGLTDYKKIKSIDIVIRDDSDDSYEFRSNPFNFTTQTALGIVRIRISSVHGTQYISIDRATGGLFDNTDHNSTSYNRGFIIIQYVE